MTLKQSTAFPTGHERIKVITLSDREVFMSLREFDRFLHADKIVFDNDRECWTEQVRPVN